MDHIVVVHDDIGCCYVGVDRGELLEPRVARFVVGRSMADWSKDGERIVLVGACCCWLCTCCYVMLL